MKKIIITGCIIWAVLLAAALAIFIPQRGKPTEEPTRNGQNPSITDLADMPNDNPVSLDLIAGKWQSDRMDKSILTLLEDGTYEDPDWLGFGAYTIKGDYIILKNGTADMVLKYRAADNQEQLYFTIADYKTIYHRATEEEIQEKLESTEQQEQENDCRTGEILNEALPILSAGAWQGDGAVISFGKDSFTIQENESAVTYRYEVPTAEYNEGDPGGYTLYWNITKDGVSQAAEPLMLLSGIDGAKEWNLYFELNGKRFEITRTIEE